MADKQSKGKESDLNSDGGDFAGQSREDYIRSLEMSLSLLQREVEHLRNQIKTALHGNSDAGFITEKPVLSREYIAAINKCSSYLDALNVFHEFHADRFSFLESGIYFLRSDRKIEQSAGTNISSSLAAQINNLEETGVIDWALEQKNVTVAPDMSMEDNQATFSIALIPLIIKGAPIGIIFVKTSKDAASFVNEDREALLGAADYAAIALDNIRSSQQITNMNKRLNALNSQMLRSSGMASVGRMTDAFSKEIDNPIQVIKANLSFLESGLGDTKRRIQIIGEQVEKINEVNKRLSMLASNYSAAPEASLIVVSEMLDEVIMFSGTQLQREGIKIEKIADDSSLKIRCMKNQMEQAIMNILFYEMNLMPDGGSLSIGIFKGDRNNAVITIADNGEGVDESEQKSMFESAGEEYDDTGKSGALYPAKKIIEEHKGVITLASELGKGSTFKISLPLSF